MAREDTAGQATSQRRIATDIAWEGALVGLGAVEAAARLLPMLAGPVPWSSIVAEAQRLRLAPLFHLGLGSSPALRAIVPPPAAEAFRRAALAAMAGVARLERATAEVVGAAAAAGLRVLVLKGLALGLLVYPSQAARPMDDADLLVAETDRPRLASILHRLGYRNDLRGEEDFFPADLAYSIDVHTGLLNTTRVPARGALWPVGFDELWRRSQIFLLGGVPARTLGPADTVLHLAVHAVHHHGLSGALWMADLEASLRAWPVARGELEAAPPAVRRSLWYCLEVLASRGLDPASEGRMAIRPRRVFSPERWALAAIRRGEAPEAIRYAFTLTCLPVWRERSAFIRQVLFPDASIYTKGFESDGEGRPRRLVHWLTALRLGSDSVRSVLAHRGRSGRSSSTA